MIIKLLQIFSAFQQAVVRNLNDKNQQSQKQLDNVVREANGEISLLNNKIAELERDLELERRKVRELQDASKDREKEYQKLKLLHDKFKRKALLAPHPAGNDGRAGFGAVQRTPMGNRTMPFIPQGRAQAQHSVGPWTPQQNPQQSHARNKSHRQPFAAPTDRSYRSTTDHSDSANEVENLLVNNYSSSRGPTNHGGWTATAQQPLRANQQGA
ncbi:hypothetical protein FPV67DRAFT_1444846 [Lyophyllum atratum]|nr:hypothetical protein FPV67DRAFT_1444846 [Lyophyllum atratum]